VAEQVSRSNGPLGDTIDMSRWGVFGHSFGGAVSVAINAEGSEFYDERVDAVLPMAPAVRIVDLLGAGTAVAHSPTLILGGLADATVGYENDQVFGYETGRLPKGLVGIHKAGHFSFTELCNLNVVEIAAKFDIDATNIVADGCGPDFLPPEDFNRVQNYFATAFFNRYLRGSERAAEDLDPANLPVDVENFVEYSQQGLAP
jgi:predicted dienelactone hydrolase